MTNPLTITKIAEAAGVGTATVDRVLNNRPGVNPTTVGRVGAPLELAVDPAHFHFFDLRTGTTLRA